MVYTHIINERTEVQTLGAVLHAKSAAPPCHDVTCYYSPASIIIGFFTTFERKVFSKIHGLRKAYNEAVRTLLCAYTYIETSARPWAAACVRACVRACV